MAAKDPNARRLIASMGANALYAAGADPVLQTEAARAGQQRRFERLVDPDGVLDPVERARRAEYARKLHMQRMALKSVQARKARKQQADPAA